MHWQLFSSCVSVAALPNSVETEDLFSERWTSLFCPLLELEVFFCFPPPPLCRRLLAPGITSLWRLAGAWLADQ